MSDCSTLAQKEKERSVLEPFKGLYVSERGHNTAVSGMNLPHGPSIWDKWSALGRKEVGRESWEIP